MKNELKINDYIKKGDTMNCVKYNLILHDSNNIYFIMDPIHDNLANYAID